MSSTSTKMINAAELTRVRQAKYAKRKRVNQVALTLSLAAMAFGVFWLVWILWETITLGIGGLSLALLQKTGGNRLEPIPPRTWWVLLPLVVLVLAFAAGWALPEAIERYAPRL